MHSECLFTAEGSLNLMFKALTFIGTYEGKELRNLRPHLLINLNIFVLTSIFPIQSNLVISVIITLLVEVIINLNANNEVTM